MEKTQTPKINKNNNKDVHILYNISRSSALNSSLFEKEVFERIPAA